MQALQYLACQTTLDNRGRQPTHSEMMATVMMHVHTVYVRLRTAYVLFIYCCILASCGFKALSVKSTHSPELQQLLTH